MKFIFLFSFSFCLFTVHAQEYMDKKNGRVNIYYGNSKNVRETGDVKEHYRDGEWNCYSTSESLLLTENFSAGILNGAYVEYYNDTKQVKTTGTYANGKMTGEWIGYYDDGKKQSIAHYDANGKPVGVEEEFFENERIQSYILVRSDGTDVRTYYTKDGNVCSVTNYKNGMKDGEEKIYDTGDIQNLNDTAASSDAFYSAGKLNGKKTEYLHGKKIAEQNFKNGKNDGALARWDVDGNLLYTENYSNGLLDGTTTYYNGKNISAVINYSAGHKNGKEEHFYPSKSRSWWTYGILDSSYAYYPDGKLKEKCARSSTNTQLLLCMQKDSVGHIIHKWNTDRSDRKEGEEIFYYPNGKMKSDIDYVDGVAMGTFTIYNKSGIKVLQATCNGNNPSSAFVVLSDAGTKIDPANAAYIDQVKKYLPLNFNLCHSNATNSYGIIFTSTPQKDFTIKELDDVTRTAEISDGNVDVPVETINNQEEIFSFAEQMPEFPGGEDSLQHYLSRTVKYPEIEKESGKMGTVYVGFVIEKDGSVSNVAIKKSSGTSGFDKEAMRVFSLMPKWEPGKMNGRAVRVQMIQPLRFVMQ
ncbi:MAG: TonB family protein [Bacteroidetes bacterium]|nr:TonB family protein [Bacteroidota bacterium]